MKSLENPKAAKARYTPVIQNCFSNPMSILQEIIQAPRVCVRRLHQYSSEMITYASLKISPILHIIGIVRFAVGPCQSAGGIYDSFNFPIENIFAQQPEFPIFQSIRQVGIHRCPCPILYTVQIIHVIRSVIIYVGTQL